MERIPEEASVRVGTLDRRAPHKRQACAKDFVTGEESDINCREIAAALGMSEGAVRVAIHRLRRRFRDLLRDEIRHTVEDPAEIDEEISFLLATVSATGSGRRSSA